LARAASQKLGKIMSFRCLKCNDFEKAVCNFGIQQIKKGGSISRTAFYFFNLGE